MSESKLNNVTVLMSVVGDHKVKAPESSLIGPIFNAGIFSVRSHLWLVAYVEDGVIRDMLRACNVPTNEEVNIPDGECIFSEAVRLWWLTGINCAAAVFQSSHNKFASTHRCLFSSFPNRYGRQILFFHRRILMRLIFSRYRYEVRQCSDFPFQPCIFTV